jgi:hypothetical protein
MIVFGIEGYEPAWQHDAEALAAVHRTRFVRLIGRKLRSSWLMWDMAERGWFADGPVILDFGMTHVEITHRKFDECAITWDQIDLNEPIDWYEHFDWRPDPHAALRRARALAGADGSVLATGSIYLIADLAAGPSRRRASTL